MTAKKAPPRKRTGQDLYLALCTCSHWCPDWQTPSGFVPTIGWSGKKHRGTDCLGVFTDRHKAYETLEDWWQYITEWVSDNYGLFCYSYQVGHSHQICVEIDGHERQAYMLTVRKAVLDDSKSDHVKFWEYCDAHGVKHPTVGDFHDFRHDGYLPQVERRDVKSWKSKNNSDWKSEEKKGKD